MAVVPNRGSPPAILLRESYREAGKTKNRTLALTVLFADLVGSTALSQALDAEDLRDVLHGYHDAVTAASQ